METACFASFEKLKINSNEWISSLFERSRTGTVAQIISFLETDWGGGVCERPISAMLMHGAYRDEDFQEELYDALIQRFGVEKPSKDGETALMVAARRDSLAGVKKLLPYCDPLAKTLGVVNQQHVGGVGWTAVMYASWRGRSKEMTALLARVSDCSVINAEGRTAFGEAVAISHYDTADLVAKGALDEELDFALQKFGPRKMPLAAAEKGRRLALGEQQALIGVVSPDESGQDEAGAKNRAEQSARIARRV